jgi:hypothetical protein
VPGSKHIYLGLYAGEREAAKVRRDPRSHASHISFGSVHIFGAPAHLHYVICMETSHAMVGF